MLGVNKNNSLVFDPPLRTALGSVQRMGCLYPSPHMGAEQVRKRILECPGVGPGGSFNASFSYKKLFRLDEEIKRKGKGTSTLGERSTTERKLYAAFGKDESLLKKNLLILFQLVDWIVSQVRGFTSRARSLVQVQDSPAAPGKIVGRKSKSILLFFFFFSCMDHLVQVRGI